MSMVGKEESLAMLEVEYSSLILHLSHANILFYLNLFRFIKRALLNDLIVFIFLPRAFFH